MDTTATNKRIREIISDLEQRRLVPNPDFQRRLVWSQKHKSEFIKTILDDLPFPEIYIAAGEVDVNTGRGYSMLVDGQQRISTLFEYFKTSPNLKLPAGILPYPNLDDDKKLKFLEYKVVVRDLGSLPRNQIIDIFERINSTSYSLNAVEIANARYDNGFKDLAERITQLPFWEKNRVFRLNEVKRMQDLNFSMVLMGTILTDYFNRDDRVEEFLIRYNDGFEKSDEVFNEINSTLSFIDELSIPDGMRAWQRADLFTLIVEIHRAIFKSKIQLDQKKIKDNLQKFYESVEKLRDELNSQVKLEFGLDSIELIITKQQIRQYYRSTTDASNDRGNRIQRGVILRDIIKASQRIAS